MERMVYKFITHTHTHTHTQAHTRAHSRMHAHAYREVCVGGGGALSSTINELLSLFVVVVGFVLFDCFLFLVNHYFILVVRNV